MSRARKISLQLATLSLLLSLTACSTGIVPMGRDTYMVARRGSSWSTAASLRAEAIREADKFCRSKGLVMVPLSTGGHDGGPGVVGSGEFTFRAVPPSDPENQRPNMERAADKYQVVEIRQR